MNRTTTVSVCIVTYNSEKDIERCLRAVLDQTPAVDWIVVVDNASSDRTCEIVQRFGGSVRLVKNRQNLGFAAGQNQAIGLNDSDYVFVLNPDVRLTPNYVMRLVSYMEQHPKIGSATGQLVLASDPTIMDSAGIDMGRSRKAWDIAGGEPAAHWERPGEIFGVSGAAAVYRRKMIKDISMDGQFFDEHYFAYKEDVDVAWRARLLGWRAYYLAEAKAVHERGWKYGGRRSRQQMPLFLRRHSYQNRIFTIIKNEPVSWRLLLNLPLLIGLEIIQIGYIILLEPGLLRCWSNIVRSLPRLLQQRKTLHRRIADRSGNSPF